MMPVPPTPQTLWQDWLATPAFLVLLLALIGVYGVGVVRRARAVGWQSISVWRVVCFGIGVFILAFSLLSPLDAAGYALLTAHLVQYTLVSTVAPPFLGVAAIEYAAWAFAPRRPEHQPVVPPETWLGQVLKRLTDPLLVGGLDLLALVVWHIPGVYEASLDIGAIHVLQQISFIVVGWLFWWVIEHPNHPRMRRQGGTLLAIGLTSTLSTAFAMAMFFSGGLWYSAYTPATTEPWGMTPKDDQQIAAVVLAGPADTLDVGSFLWVFAMWMKQQEEDQVKREQVFRAEQAARQQGA
jgi:putative membrane protein